MPRVSVTILQQIGRFGVMMDFVGGNGIEVLNVAGSRASKDALIYGKTVMVLEAVTLND